MTLVCPACGTPKAEGEGFCVRCHGNVFVQGSAEDVPPAADRLAPGTPAAPVPAPASMAARPLQLTVSLTMNGQTTRYDVAAGGRVMLGRDRDASPFAAALKYDDLVGRQHAIIEYRAGGQVLIWDRYSTNGTVVNGQELQPGEERTLAEKDQIRIGETAIVRVCVVPVPPPGDLAAEDGEGSQQ